MGDFFRHLEGVARKGKKAYAQYHGMSREEYASRSAQAIPADVRMFSGCQDAQTSADVSNVASFSLPAGTGPGGAGGACTNSLISVLSRGQNMTYVQLLEQMRQILKQKGYSQVPELSSSHEINLTEPLSFINPQSNGRMKALLIGINYVGQQGELRGCGNDVLTMKQFLTSMGFRDMQVLSDVPGVSQTAPTHRNILEAFRWLVQGAQPGDTLFFHYSGHGGRLPDDTGDEKDGYDETIVPVDYQSAGQMRDDTIVKELVYPLPQGVKLTAVMDCCHSGTVFDLPFMFVANDGVMNQVNSGQAPPVMTSNPNFNLERAIKIATTMFQGFQQGGMQGALKAGLGAFFH